MTMTDHRKIENLLSASADVIVATGHPLAETFVERLRHPGPVDGSVGAAGNPLSACLAAALAAQSVAPGAEPLRTALAEAASHLAWAQGAGVEMPEPYASNHAYVQLVGPGSRYSADDLRVGLFVIAPDTPYPAHVHEAEELYYVVSGHAGWQQDDGPFEIQPPGSVIHNVPFRPHAMTTDSETLITLWGWRGDISFDQYRFV